MAQRTAEVRAARANLKPAEETVGAGVARAMPAKVTIVPPPHVSDDERERRARLARLVEAARIPARYADADLEDCEGVPERCRGDYAGAVVELHRLITEPALVVLLGPRGAGKSWMAAALVLRFCRDGRFARYAEAMDYFLALDEARETEKRSALQVEADYLKPELLVLDAMEERADTTAKDRMLTRLINKRYAGLKATLLITNETGEKFAARVGETIADRIHDGGGMIECNWASLRGEIGGEA